MAGNYLEFRHLIPNIDMFQAFKFLKPRFRETFPKYIILEQARRHLYREQENRYFITLKVPRKYQN